MKGVNGRETKEKQDDFRALLSHHINVCRRVLNKHKWANQSYHYFDIFGGPGVIRENGENINGSPLIFADIATRYGISYEAKVFENDQQRFDSLKANLSKYRIAPIFGDSGQSIGDFLPAYPNRKIYGMLYCDPAMDEAGFDLSFDIATKFSTSYPTIDIIMYISANNIKRISGAKGTPSLIDRLAPINKNSWVIRTLRDKFQYTFIIGTNYIKPFVWGNKGFFDVNSAEGQRIITKANYTKDYLKKKLQMPLIGLMQNT